MTPLHDTNRPVETLSQRTVFNGAIWDIQRDTFRLEPQDDPMTREYIVHPGAVAIVAVDAEHRVAMIKQYRHPVGQECWEIPAGLMDAPGEDLLTTAQRELSEEADLQADTWTVLVDHYPSAGSSSEAIRIFLAQDLVPVPAQHRHDRQDEEAYLVLQWVPLRQAIQAVLAGHIRNVNAVAGLLAAQLVVNGDHEPRTPDVAF